MHGPVGHRLKGPVLPGILGVPRAWTMAISGALSEAPAFWLVS